MFAILAPIMLAAAAHADVATSKAAPTFDPKALATCMAFTAQGQDYTRLSDQDIPRNISFLDEVMGICSHEILPMWDEAHARARVELNLPIDSSHRMTPDEARRSVSEMETAERQLRGIVAAHWAEAQLLRNETLDIPSGLMTSYMRGWLMSGHHADDLARSSDKSTECVGAAIRNNENVQTLISGKNTRASAIVEHNCEFDAAVEAVSATLRQRFVNADPTVAYGVADNFLRQLVFWSLMEQH